MTEWWKNYQVDVPETESGEWKIERFVVDEEAAEFQKLRALMSYSGRFAPAGTYTRLVANGRGVVMSDTPNEIEDHLHFIYRAEGKVLVAGLGLGMVLQALLSKEEVTHVDIVEISHDVIQMVEPHYRLKFPKESFSIIHADILKWQPPKGETWDHIWYDIWDEICVDNWDDMKALHRKFGRRCGGNQDSWMRDWIKSELAKERRQTYGWW